MNEDHDIGGSPDNSAIVNAAYDETLLRCLDIVERGDFYGILAADGVGAFARHLALGPESHVLDIGSGIGGPARFLARNYGCRVTGVDLSAFNQAVAVERTRSAGLAHLVECRHGDALRVPLAAGSFTHVFFCETLCYFPEKATAFDLARRMLRPGGRVAFLEAACDAPLRLRTEEHIGPVRYESRATYESLLLQAGFVETGIHDTSEAAQRDIARSLCRLLDRKEDVIAAAGEAVYYPLLEIWAEFLACLTEGRMRHLGCIARKPPAA